MPAILEANDVLYAAARGGTATPWVHRLLGEPHREGERRHRERLHPIRREERRDQGGKGAGKDRNSHRTDA